MTRLALLQEQSMEVDGLRVALRTEHVLLENGFTRRAVAPPSPLIEKMISRLEAHLDRILAEIEKERAYGRICRGGGE